MMKPIRLAATATQSLPRTGLALLVFIYLVVGAIGRDPSHSDDAIAFGAITSMALGQISDWIIPNISGDFIYTGPLSLWLRALSTILLSPFVDPVVAGRLPSIFALLITVFALWRWVYRLAILSTAQPLALPFGGHPSIDSYARMCADCAVLLFIGSLGLLFPSHAAGGATLLLMWVVLFLLSSSYLKRRFQMATIEGVILAALALTWNIPLAIAMWLTRGVLLFHQQNYHAWQSIIWTLLISIFGFSLWLIAAYTVNDFYLSLWWDTQTSLISWFTAKKIVWLLQNSAWFFFPSLPFALWAIWKWRYRLTNPHLLSALLFSLIFLLFALFFAQESDLSLLIMLPPLALLGAFGLPTMGRGGINGIDWFSLVIFTLVALFIWLIWSALVWRWPVSLFLYISSLSEVKSLSFNILTFIIALAATLGWIMLAYWRITYKPNVLWRTVILSVAGVLLCWLLLMTLLLGLFNQLKSYRSLATILAQNISRNECAYDLNLDRSARALLVFYGHIRFKETSQDCNYLFKQGGAIKTAEPKIILGTSLWLLKDYAHKPNHPNTGFYLYHKETQK